MALNSRRIWMSRHSDMNLCPGEIAQSFYGFFSAQPGGRIDNVRGYPGDPVSRGMTTPVQNRKV